MRNGWKRCAANGSARAESRPSPSREEDGKYRVTVMHRNHKGGSEAETYLVRETEGVLFIETGFAVMMDYDREKDRIRLSPGGEYRRKSDGTLKQ